MCDATTGESSQAIYADDQCNVLFSELPYTNTECAPCENLSCGYSISCTDDGEYISIFSASGAFGEGFRVTDYWYCTYSLVIFRCCSAR